MANRNSGASINSDNYVGAVVGEASIAIRVTPKTLEQLSSSASAVKNNRMRKVMTELHKAVASAKNEQLAESVVTKKKDPKDEDTKERK